MLFQAICSLIRDLSAVSTNFHHFAAQQPTVAPTVAPTQRPPQVSGNCRSASDETTKYSFFICFVPKNSGTYGVPTTSYYQYFMQFFLHESIMYLQCDIENYVKMINKTCILPLRYLNMHTVALLCAILYIIRYIYKIKKELCKSEQWKYLISKSALVLYEFEVKSLHSIRFLHWFLCYIHDLIQISNIMLLPSLLLY